MLHEFWRLFQSLTHTHTVLGVCIILEHTQFCILDKHIKENDFI